MGPNPNEYDTYGVITEAFIYHKQPHDRYTIFPQYYLQWKPNEPKDRRASIPDFALGRYIDGWPWVRLQGGAEVKRANPEMKGLPPPATVGLSRDVQNVVYNTRFQARDQAVCAIKEGRLPNQRVKWLIFVGPYFAEIEIGPFSDAELQTRTHKPNSSGDYVELLITKVEKQAPSIYVPLYLLGTDEGVAKLENYINETSRFSHR
ncbi:hypothetical protein JOM56_003031 [Amanita muscaria]|uniref:Uncharacterized protein n=1 Tax=Amanita muscaria (strain Koide BX008) TaxID=946122 RepID=A0A0C2WIU6_AMAMK|nr:hypothetical protein M378DRAFT_89136 [Amanita muscaria Koide BX008]